jgi:hypothetical protein
MNHIVSESDFNFFRLLSTKSFKLLIDTIESVAASGLNNQTWFKHWFALGLLLVKYKAEDSLSLEKSVFEIF